jgi:Gti1/Pac2 family transcription factor
MDSSPLCFTFGMQRPTLENVRIRSTRDALHVFYGVARGVLPLITRRLDVDERRNISAGHAYVWEERSPTSESQTIGMERWCVAQSLLPLSVFNVDAFFRSQDRRHGLGPKQ